MPIRFDPAPGDLLRCNYEYSGPVVPPEMGKLRPVVVLAKTARKLCLVVPMSTQVSRPQVASEHKMDTSGWPPHLAGNDNWAKSALLSVVSYERLDRFHDGRRNYRRYAIEPNDFEAIRHCVARLLFPNGVSPP